MKEVKSSSSLTSHEPLMTERQEYRISYHYQMPAPFIFTDEGADQAFLLAWTTTLALKKRRGTKYTAQITALWRDTK
jgi:hypothetical protein